MILQLSKIQTNCCRRVRAPSWLDRTKSLPVVCSAVDPWYAHLQFLSTEQREIAHELISWMESLEINGDKEGTDSKKCTQRPMDHQLRGVRVLRKTVPCTFSWALSQRKNLLIQAVMSWITSFSWSWLQYPGMLENKCRETSHSVKSSETAVVHPCYVCAFWEISIFPLQEILSQRRELASNQTVWTC